MTYRELLKFRTIVAGCLTALVLGWSAAAVSVEPETRYMIKYKKGRVAVVEGAVREARGKRMRRRGRASRRLLSAGLSRAQVRRLRRSRDIESIEVDPPRFLSAETVPYGIQMVQADNFPGSLGFGVSRTLCIIDTGYDQDHVDLPPPGDGRVTGDSQIPGEDWFEDGHGHGTHVAGTIAAVAGNGEGVVGVHTGSNLKLHIVKVFDNNGAWTYASDLINALDQCVDAGSHVVSMSLGGGYSSLEEASFNEAAQNVLLVAAAGNYGNGWYSYPASYSGVISVAAVDSTESRASFSQYNNQVELAAPGVGVLSTLPGNDYASWSGTSMATPHVAAVGAVLWGRYEGCTANQIRNVLAATAVDLGPDGRDNEYGFGLVQLRDADAQLEAEGSCEPVPEPVLGNGAPLTNLSGDTGTEYPFQITVPTGATNLVVQTSGGTGDADLYLRANAAPTVSAYDCRPYSAGNVESCSESQPTTETYHGMLRAYAAFSGVTLVASWDEPEEVNEPPEAVVSVLTAQPEANAPVEFSGSDSSAPDGTLVEWSWTFGDGQSGDGQRVSHTYASAGTYDVTLTVGDNRGATSSTVVQVSVAEPPPVNDIAVEWSENRKGTRMVVRWSGAVTARVEIYRDGVRVARTRNDNRWRDKTVDSSATYVVCNDRDPTCPGSP